MKTQRFEIFRSPLFVVCLALLLANDFWWKNHFSNVITGKLSDFAGLFIFPLFLTAIFPSGKKYAFVLTFFGFIIWKTPVANSFVDLWSTWIFRIERVVDYSDFIALLSLPLAYWYHTSDYTKINLNPYLIGLVALFSFTATSRAKNKVDFKNPIIQAYRISAMSLSDYENQEQRGFIVEHRGEILYYKINWIDIGYFPPLEDNYEQARIKSKFFVEGDFTIRGDKLNGQFKDTIFGQVQELNFVDSRLHGKQTAYYENGQPEIISYFNSGLETGQWQFYNSYGILEKTETYKEGELQETVNLSNGERLTVKADTRRSTIIKSILSLLVLSLVCIALICILIFYYKKNRPFFYDDIQNKSIMIIAMLIICIFHAVGALIAAGFIIKQIPILHGTSGLNEMFFITPILVLIYTSSSFIYYWRRKTWIEYASFFSLLTMIYIIFSQAYFIFKITE
jgi:hypothetical protein